MSTSFLFSQTAKGRVLITDRIPVPGAHVMHLNSEHHTHTNDLGNFFLNGVYEGDTLQFSYLGYETQKVVVKNVDEKIVVQLEEAAFILDEVLVGQTPQTMNVITKIDVQLNPVRNSQEILQRVPGLFIGQHAGGGKAEQLFLRGFDIDHGTDVAISVDGMPVNMVSHAHGQGYADLHFIIPETVEEIDFGKGTYYADKGNFTTAGYVDFSTKDRLSRSMISAEIGDFNTVRTVGLLNLVNTEKHSAYAAAEYIQTDGPFESSQHFSRINMMAKYSVELNNRNRISILASHFDSKWDASGQIPFRSVNDGSITRFGAIDDTEGGFTGRTNVAIEFNRTIDERTFLKANAYYSRYDFELYSNFTFFLEDPTNGDQIRQRENREIFGFQTEWNRSVSVGNTTSLLQIGIGSRYDNVDDVELSRTRDRQTTLEPIQLGDIDETNLFAYANMEFEFGDLTINPGLRLDHFTFNYVDALTVPYDRQDQMTTFLGPKLNFGYHLNNNAQLYLKSGIGFHSNDTRVVLDRTAEDILPLAYGVDLGTLFKPTSRLFINAALWYLFLEQEFVYVGDAGIVEPSGQSQRLGFDVGIRYQITDWLFANADVNYAFARSIDEPDGADLIPLAPVLTSVGGLSVIKITSLRTSIIDISMTDLPTRTIAL